MANNVLEQTIDKEIHTSSNQIACTIIETLIPFTNDENFERFQRQFGTSFRPICSDKFASHILQKLVSVSMLRAVAPTNKVQSTTNESTTGPLSKKRKTIADVPGEKEYNLTADFSDEHRQVCREFVEKVSKFLLNNLEDFVWDTYASHVMRTCFDSLTGVYQFKKSFITSTPNEAKSNDPNDIKPLTVPDEWSTEILLEYATRLQAWPQFPDFPYDELSSALLQSLCTALHTCDKSNLKHLGKRILNEAFLNTDKPVTEAGDDSKVDVKENSEVDEKTDIEVSTEQNGATEQEEIDLDLPPVFTSEPAVRCLEALINVAGPKLFTQIYVKLFFGRLAKLSVRRLSNFSVQKLLDKVRTKEEFEPMFDELVDSFGELLQVGHTGVVSSLAQGCLRLCAKQGPFMKSIQTALDCLQPKEKSDQFALLTLKLKPYQVAQEDKSNFVHLHGALILQAMLQFNKPIKLIQCILEMKNNELTEIFCSPKGSHIVDAFMSSKAVGEKSREKLIRHMNGCFLEMAISRNGSWAVEKFFNAAGDSQKARIVKELVEKQNQLNSSPSGRCLNFKLHVDLYRLSPEQWRSSFNKESRAEKLFKGILS